MVAVRYISILLSMVVVLCPFHCLFGGCLAASAGETTIASVCCNSCDSPDSPAPQNSGDCECGDYFCRGALPANDVSADVSPVDLAAVFVEWLKPFTDKSAAPAPQVKHASFLLTADATAVEARAALSCWLI